MEDALELVMTPTLGAAGVRVRLVKPITSIGSAPDADLRLHSLPSTWATVQRDGAAALFRVLADGASHRLAPGEPVIVDGMTVELGRPRHGVAGAAIDELASRLAACEAPDEALAILLDGALSATGAPHGAIVLADRDGWTVAARRDGGEADPLAAPAVREVLAGAERPVTLDGALALPLRLDGRTLGAILLGADDVGERAIADLRLSTALALPLIAHVRLARERGDALAATSDLLIGASPAIEQVRRLIERIGPTDLGVLIAGAPGTGKQLVARALHAASGRAPRPLIAVHCASFSAGQVAAATDSTLVLDEVGDLSPPTQAALLRALEQRRVDLRLLAITSRDLVAEVAAGRFREDLLTRLDEVRIELPTLRERGDDVLLLARVFLRQTEAQLGLRAHGLAPDAIEILRRYPWPGNVRELRAAMRRVAILADGSSVRGDDLQLAAPVPPRPPTPPHGSSAVPAPPPRPGTQPELGDTSRPLAEAREEFIRRYVAAVLDRCGGNREAAAREMGIGVRTLYRYLG